MRGLTPGAAAIAILALVIAIPTPASASQRSPGARERYERAVALQATGDHPAALAMLWEAAALAPHDADILNRLGDALDRLGALDAAIDAYRRALAERPSYRKAENSLILTLVKAGKGPEAVARARTLVAADPNDPDRVFTLALAQSEQDYEESIRSFRRVLEVNPRHTLARYNLALVLKRADRLADAIDELKRALDIDPRPEAYYTLGVIYQHQGELDRAAGALRSAIAARPDYTEAHSALGAVLKARGDLKGAAVELRRTLALRPDLWSAHASLATVLRSSGDEEGARAHAAEAERLRRLAEREQEASVWTSVGTRKLEEGDFLGALDCFRRATTVVATYAPAYYQMGRALRALGTPEAAREAFERARQLNPSLVPPPMAADR